MAAKVNKNKNKTKTAAEMVISVLQRVNRYAVLIKLKA
jgi:hypothetical protein